MMIYSVFFAILLLVFFFYFKFKNYVPILMYHRIADVPGDRNALPPEKFRKQMDFLAQNGFTTVTMEAVYDYYAAGKPLPQKPVLLTFDDGYEDNYSIALPILTKYQMNAVVFPIADWIGRENKWENFSKAPTRTMTWEELQKWQAAGLSIASHTVTHPFLSTYAEDELKAELSKSKETLEYHLRRPIDFLCYPYGNFDQKTIAAMKSSGYKAGFAIFDGVPLWNIDLFALPRIPIPARQSLWEFKLKVSGIHIIFIALRQWERKIKKFFRK